MVTDIRDLVITHLQDAYAMEQNVLGMLDSMIANTKDPQMKNLLQQHHEETVTHGNRVKNRLQELGHSTSATKNVGAMLGGMFKSVTDVIRSEKAAKNLRDGFITEHLEIAGYELLERIANRAGDSQTAAMCRENKQDEINMAHRLNDSWDRAVDDDLREMGIQYDRTGAPTGAYGHRSDAAERGATWTASSTDADMGMGLHGDRAAPQTSSDPLEANIPQSGNVGTRASTPMTQNP